MKGPAPLNIEDDAEAEADEPISRRVSIREDDAEAGADEPISRRVSIREDLQQDSDDEHHDARSLAPLPNIHKRVPGAESFEAPGMPTPRSHATPSGNHDEGDRQSKKGTDRLLTHMAEASAKVTPRTTTKQLDATGCHHEGQKRLKAKDFAGAAQVLEAAWTMTRKELSDVAEEVEDRKKALMEQRSKAKAGLPALAQTPGSRTPASGDGGSMGRKISEGPARGSNAEFTKHSLEALRSRGVSVGLDLSMAYGRLHLWEKVDSVAACSLEMISPGSSDAHAVPEDHKGGREDEHQRFMLRRAVASIFLSNFPDARAFLGQVLHIEPRSRVARRGLACIAFLETQLAAVELSNGRCSDKELKEAAWSKGTSLQAPDPGYITYLAEVKARAAERAATPSKTKSGLRLGSSAPSTPAK
eukprot:CAMPEP_0170583256 /NCGR_PEP_ID=MMETSP0224-20130122/8030_1 /TAXON_ID=285029 /ORGANISM="Togula jolla, Strain CCCM 725" /LENGTH=415 /DNA_ID=CAMNT_0010906555 /DNA_START=133 /DNA_END=1377 /DNA_ORIENTATION=+